MSRGVPRNTAFHLKGFSRTRLCGSIWTSPLVNSISSRLRIPGYDLGATYWISALGAGAPGEKTIIDAGRRVDDSEPNKSCSLTRSDRSITEWTALVSKNLSLHGLPVERHLMKDAASHYHGNFGTSTCEITGPPHERLVGLSVRYPVLSDISQSPLNPFFRNVRVDRSCLGVPRCPRRVTNDQIESLVFEGGGSH